MGEVKKKYQKIDGSCIQGVDEVQLTMIAVENFNSYTPLLHMPSKRHPQKYVKHSLPLSLFGVNL